MSIYTQAQLLSDINARIKGKSGILVDSQSTINQGVRQTIADLDLVSTRRRAALSPNLFSGVFGAYASPTDLKGYGIVSIQNQKLTNTPDWSLVPYEEFLRRQDANTVAVSDYDLIRKIFINSSISDTSVKLSTLDSTTAGGGTWSLFGDAENVAAATDNHVEGSGSLKFDISAAGGTTAGIVNSTLDSQDLETYFDGSGNCLVWTFLTSATDVTNFVVRVGSSATDYHTVTVTAQADGTSFVQGWNLLNFDFATFTTVGTPAETAITYFTSHMTKDAGKVTETGYRFDSIIFRKGEINNLYYYSSYGWRTSAGVYLRNSTAASDLLNANDEEYEIILAKCTELASEEVDEDKVTERQARRYEDLKGKYMKDHPSESLIMISTVADFETL